MKLKNVTYRYDGSELVAVVAQCGHWRVTYYPQYGGHSVDQHINGIGWCIDANEEIPVDLYMVLGDAAGVPEERLAATA